jgi:hypothetical protein
MENVFRGLFDFKIVMWKLKLMIFILKNWKPPHIKFGSLVNHDG